MKIQGMLAIALLLGSTGCAYITQGVFAPDDRGAIALDSDHFDDSAKRIVYLDQGWDEVDSLWYYNTSQGSNYLPYEIFLWLEQADSERFFRDNENISKFRYMPQYKTFDNPDGLPVGFVKDTHNGRDYVGFTCAACHSSQVNYQGVGMRIDGAGTMADMDSFNHAIVAALKATLNDEAKLERLSKNIKGKTDPATLTALKQDLALALKDREDYNTVNRIDVPYGYARLDAFGRIYNRVLQHLKPVADNRNPPSAPVSYPFLWDTPQHDYVQWNGVASNALGGALGRNVGEVLGVFGTYDLDRKKGDVGYRASVRKRNLNRLEKHLSKLESPQWPEDILPAINQDLAKQGDKLFDQYCASCHLPIDRSESDRRVFAQFFDVNMIKTDDVMASNAIAYSGQTGVFEGESVAVVSFKFKKDRETFGPTSPVLPLLSNAAMGVILEPDHDKLFLRRWVEQAWDLLVGVFSGGEFKETPRQGKFDETNPLFAYKARPLNGIWATAPYLHNGAIPTLYDMLLPKKRPGDPSGPQYEYRPDKFNVGSRELDAVKVGITTSKGGSVFDTSRKGNSNEGHEYGAGRTPQKDGTILPALTKEQRLALVEYMKTL